jgi:hypothetical protein
VLGLIGILLTMFILRLISLLYTSNYVDIPTFLTDDFVISVSATNVSADMSDISTRYETRRYKVIR